MKSVNPVNREYMLSHLDRGHIVKTTFGHYAAAFNGLVYVAATFENGETLRHFIDRATPMTWDSFLHLYPVKGDILAASNGRAY